MKGEHHEDAMAARAVRGGGTLAFIPMYNCSSQIVRVIDAIARDHHPAISHYLFIDNRSTDGTADAAIAHARSTLGDAVSWSVVRNVENYGLGGSHKAAFRHALENGYERVLVLHGDDQASLADAHDELARDPGVGDECRLGARFMTGSRLEGYSRFRTLGNIVFNIAFSLAGRRAVFDLGSGLNLYSRRFLERRLHEACNDDLTFNYHLILHSMTYRVPFDFFPISWREADQRSNVKMVRQATRMILMLARYVLSPRGFHQRLAREKGGRSYVFERLAASDETSRTAAGMGSDA